MHLEHSEFIAVPTEIFWKTWINVNDWHAWDLTINAAQSDTGEFDTLCGTFILPKGQTQKFHFTKIEEEKMYAFEINLPFTNMHIIRRLKPVDGGVIVTHEFDTDGVMLLPNAFYRSVKKYFKQSLIKLKYFAEESYWRTNISKIPCVDRSPAMAS
ncbi:MAG: hypothetical protein H7Y00_04995 [Fimbriimonadaceae bacterium]|nr:hypothetical protein [Chitinophagales bacterium]